MEVSVVWWEDENPDYFRHVYEQAAADKDTLGFVHVRSWRTWECRVGPVGLDFWWLQAINKDKTPLTDEQKQAFLQLAKVRYPL